MLKTIYEYDSEKKTTTIKFVPFDARDMRELKKIIRSHLFDIENPFFTYSREVIESIKDKKKRESIESALGTLYDYCWSIGDEPLPSANPLYLLEHSLNTMIDMQETIYGLNQHIDCLEEVAITEPLYMTPCFAFDEDCLEFSTCADIKGMKAIRLLKYDFRNTVTGGIELTKQQEEFIELITGGKDVINYSELMYRIVNLLWEYYCETD